MLWTASESEKQRALVNEHDGAFLARLKIMNLRGELKYDIWTGLPNPRHKAQTAPARRPPQQRQATAPLEDQPFTPGGAIAGLLFILGLAWLLIWYIGGDAHASPYRTSIRTQTAAELKAECDRLATFKRAQGEQAALGYWQACMKGGPKTVTERTYR